MKLEIEKKTSNQDQNLVTIFTYEEGNFQFYLN